jgi:hypothetical protein
MNTWATKRLGRSFRNETGHLTTQVPLRVVNCDSQPGYFTATFLNENGMSTVAFRWPENTNLLGVVSLPMA